MEPTLLAGDHVVVLGFGRFRPGDLVAVRDPEHPDLVLVKRVVDVGADGVALAGDNAARSRDSRHFGLVEPRAILGRVVYRYSPPRRAGRLAGHRQGAGAPATGGPATGGPANGWPANGWPANGEPGPGGRDPTR